MSWFTTNNLLLLFFVGTGLLLIYLYFRNAARVRESEGWPTSQGTIVESQVQANTTTDFDSDSSTSYYPQVRYVYHVLGSEYQGTKIAFGLKAGGTQNKAMEMISKYPKGSTVTVYYDPEQPSKAVLERTISKSLLVYGVLFIAIGIFLFVKVF